jgi:predicted TIM-barrel fold metal-dependent hydrolase
MSGIDAHAHVFHRGLALASNRRYTPGYDAPLETYLAELDKAGLDHGVLVQPSFLGTDNSYLVESLVRAGGRLRGIVVLDPTTSADALRALDRAGVAGIRLNLVGRALPDLDDSIWRNFLAAIAGLGWQIELQRRAPDLPALVTRLRAHDLTVVLDHFALPDPAIGVTDPAFAEVLKLGTSGQVSGNVWVKLSGAYRNGPHGHAFALAAYPVLREAFGIDRLMWGSDWPHTRFEATESYAANRAFLDALIPDERERARVLAGPRALFRF